MVLSHQQVYGSSVQLPQHLLILPLAQTLIELNQGGVIVNHPAIQAGSLPVSQAANLPGYYKIPNKTRDPLLTAHNFSSVPSTMRT